VLALTKDKRIVGEKDCSSVYLELLARDFGQGIVEIRDEDEHAFCAGYSSNRARRTWQERIKLLEREGFIQTVPKGNRSTGYVLIVHPLQAVAGLRRQGKVTDELWRMFQQRLLETGCPPLEESDVSGELVSLGTPEGRPSARVSLDGERRAE
jgi:hypothetical protein